jgi:hypothetical protein
MLYRARSSCVNFFKHFFGFSALLDLVNIMQVELYLHYATETKIDHFHDITNRNGSLRTFHQDS